MSRAIRTEFLNEFIQGKLSILLDAVHNDTTLNMELREDKVEVYYRGRLLFTVMDKSMDLICSDSCWERYKGKLDLVTEPSSIQTFIDNIALYKTPIDYYLSNVKEELEEQCKQQLVLENNVFGKNTTKSSDYFILDTEYKFADGETLDARFDAIALRWKSTTASRKKTEGIGISFLELKYFDSAKTGKAGIKKHIDDYLGFIKRDEYHDMCRDMEEVFVQKCKLGLIPAYNQADKCEKIGINDDISDLVFVFANSDPDGCNDAEEWRSVKNYDINDLKKIYIGQASGFGYSLFRYENEGADDRYIKYTDLKL